MAQIAAHHRSMTVNDGCSAGRTSHWRACEILRHVCGSCTRVSRCGILQPGGVA